MLHPLGQEALWRHRMAAWIDPPSRAAAWALEAVEAASGELLADLRSSPDLRAREVDAPSDGSKGAATEILVSLGASGSIAGFVRIIQLWLGRDRRRSLTVSVGRNTGEETISIEGDNLSVDALTKALDAVVATDKAAQPKRSSDVT